MSAELFVHPERSPFTWEELKETHPIGSIALDGYVADGPLFDGEGPYANLNHHENVNRLMTLSTAQQVLNGIRMGLDKPFIEKGSFSPNVFVNDCDQDVCAAWYLLKNVDQTRHPSPALNRFVNVAGMLDVTAGAFPYDPDMRILGELAWVFAPYTEFRLSGSINNKSPEQFESVIRDVEHRITAHVMGRGESKQIEGEYKVIGGGKDWSMIEEIGKDGKVGALSCGVDAYVVSKQIDSDRWRYTVGRRSEYIPFDVPAIIEKLNEVEGCIDDRWGGADIVGGSPRVNGSCISPSELEAIVNDFLSLEKEPAFTD